MAYSFDDTIYLEAYKAVKFGPESKFNTVYSFFPTVPGYYRVYCQDGRWGTSLVKVTLDNKVNPGTIRQNLNSTWSATLPPGYTAINFDPHTTTLYTTCPLIPQVKVQCHCGTTITMGSADHPEFHSDYCPVRTKV